MPSRPGIRAMADLATPMSIRVGATLGVADHVASGATSLSLLAVACRADKAALARLLQHWTWLGLLENPRPDTYALTDLGQQLRSNHPGGKRQWLDIAGGVGRGDLCFIDLLHTVQTGEPAYPIRYGRDFWDDLAQDEDLGSSFDALMRRHVEADNQGLVSAVNWHELNHVVDVGGGSGALLSMLLRAFPHLQGTLVDLPGPANRARTVFDNAGLTDRVTVVDGSFFDQIPTGGDAYILCAILHDWDDDASVSLLRACATAAGSEGRILVIESVGADGESVDPRMDLRMLAYTGGKERGVAELATLGRAAGLDLVATHRVPLASYMAVVELRARSGHHTPKPTPDGPA